MSKDDRFDMSIGSGDYIKKEYVDIPGHGFVSFDPNTNQINGDNEVDGLHTGDPVELPKRFWHTKQPHIFSCSEPGPGNRGCLKYPGCKIGQRYPYSGPGPVIIRDRGIGPPNADMCYHYFEATRGGRPTSQHHLGMDGWKLDTSRTTIELLGRTRAIEAGRVTDESSRQAVINSKPQVWEKEIGGLLPPWWPLMKKKGLPLPAAAELYPELTEALPEEESSTPSTAHSPRSASRVGRKRRTSKPTGS